MSAPDSLELYAPKDGDNALDARPANVRSTELRDIRIGAAKSIIFLSAWLFALWVVVVLLWLIARSIVS